MSGNSGALVPKKIITGHKIGMLDRSVMPDVRIFYFLFFVQSRFMYELFFNRNYISG
jgi:hypothetical protein